MEVGPEAPTRPVLRYHGGKWKLAWWILKHFPPHHVYIEPFGGAASVLLKKPRSYGEVYNDLDAEVVNLFRVLKDEFKAHKLRRLLELTPFARDEFKAAYEDPTCDVDRAYKMIVRAFMGFGSASMTRTHMTGFRSNSNRSGTTPATDWANWPQYMPQIVERLRGVIIENKDAVELIAQHDEERALIYADPPYVPETRSSLGHKNGNAYPPKGATPGTNGHYYRHDMRAEDHERLAAALHEAKGMVCVSGYQSELYERLYAGWEVRTIEHMADGARPRLEALWLSPRLSAALRAQDPQMKLIE